eukprot:TRINITY_DN488_c1_g1_i1.p1 TRINITY_DN488_c1_g1~~TRINITY_DN488_c1_g1_i1.p1  ORF type:complete len:297 (+),score=30.87 TRINITY_DN488_c1_g1_i1:48-938(+)
MAAPYQAQFNNSLFGTAAGASIPPPYTSPAKPPPQYSLPPGHSQQYPEYSFGRIGSPTAPPGEFMPAISGGDFLGGGKSVTDTLGFAVGQQVESTKDLAIAGPQGEVLVVVPPAGKGVVLGPATTGDPARLAVLFESYQGEPLNVVPEEVRNSATPFDPTSTSIETQLARILWEGRDPLAHQSPRDQPDPKIEVRPMALPTQVKQKPPVAVNPAYRDRLLRFFERYNPHRLPSVPALLQEYAGCEDALVLSLVKKYGPEPVDVLPDLPPGWCQVQSSKGHVFYRHVSGSRQWNRPQ